MARKNRTGHTADAATYPVLIIHKMKTKISPIAGTAAICIALLIATILSAASPLPTDATKANAMVMMNRNGESSPYRQWLGHSITELTEIGKTALETPDSLPRAIQAFTAIVGQYEGGAIPDKDIRSVVSAMNNLGYIYTFHYLDYRKGIRYLTHGLEIAENKNVRDLIPVICLNLGAIYSLNQLQFAGKSFADKSMEVYLKGLKTAQEVKDWRNYMKLLNNILNINESNNGKPLQKEILAGFPKTPELSGRDIMYSFTREHIKAYQALTSGKTDEAVRHYTAMEGMTDGFQDEVRYRLMAMSAKAMAFERMKDLRAAAAEIERALDIAKKNGYDDISVFFYDDARRIYNSMGDTERAEQFHILHLKQKDSIFNACQMKAVSEFQFHQEIDRMENTVRDLSYNKKILSLWLWALGAFAILAVLFAIYYNLTNRRLRQRNQSLYQKNITNLRIEDENLELKKDIENLRKELSDNHSRESESADIRSEDKKKYSYSRLDDERKEEIRQKMERIMEEDKDVFSQDFSLGMLAEKIGCPQSYLSQVISEKTDKTFYGMLSERRIKEACRLMTDPANRHLTIEGIASEVGIKSRSNFTSLFKKFTGLTPGEFARQTKETDGIGK